MDVNDLMGNFLGFIMALLIWSIVWKGLALWRAAILKQKIWFILLLVINTGGLLEIIYLLATNQEWKEKNTTQSK